MIKKNRQKGKGLTDKHIKTIAAMLDLPDRNINKALKMITRIRDSKMAIEYPEMTKVIPLVSQQVEDAILQYLRSLVIRLASELKREYLKDAIRAAISKNAKLDAKLKKGDWRICVIKMMAIRASETPPKKGINNTKHTRKKKTKMDPSAKMMKKISSSLNLKDNIISEAKDAFETFLKFQLGKEEEEANETISLTSLEVKNAIVDFHIAAIIETAATVKSTKMKDAMHEAMFQNEGFDKSFFVDADWELEPYSMVLLVDRVWNEYEPRLFFPDLPSFIP